MANNRRYRGQKLNRSEARYPDRVTFRLSSKHLQELEDLAVKEGVSRSVLVRHLVVRFLDSRRFDLHGADFEDKA